MTYVIETSNLGVQLAQSTILHPISIAVKKGENVGIIGSNGAGKSTLLRAILGLIPHNGTSNFTSKSTHEKMSLVVQKATELGITEINVCKTDRSSISIETDQLKKRKVHWRRVAIAACEQSGRTQIPKINTYLSLTSCLEELPAENTEQTKLILSPQGSTRLKDISVSPANLNIAVGPEGGFSDDEIAFAKSTGFIEFQTGPRTLRAETAGISMAAIAQALWGDF